MLIRVQSGTNAGRRRVLELADWICRCPRSVPGYRYSCPDCGDRRPS